MLKNILFLILAVCTVSFTSCSKIPDFKKLGTEKFTAAKWHTASQEERGKMLSSFFLQYDVLNKKPAFVKKLLGKPNAYSGYESDPAYVVGPKNINSSNNKGGYVVSFNTNKKNGLIINVSASPNL